MEFTTNIEEYFIFTTFSNDFIYSFELHVYFLFQIADLKTYVDFLKNKCDKQFYINAWQVIIDKTFQEIIHVSNEDLEKTLINNFLMIQVCLVDQYVIR